MKNLLKLSVLTCIMAVYHVSYAQQSHSSGAKVKMDPNKVKISSVQEPHPNDTVREKWLNSLILLRSIYNKTNGPAVKDTSMGTAFLLSDHGKLYLVTAKNIITSTQYGKNEQLPNDTISVDYFSYLHFSSKINFNLGGLSGKGAKRPAVVFTDDEKNIAIISLQKKEYKAAATDLLAHGCMPISVNLFDTTNDHHAGEQLIKYGRSMIGEHEGSGWGVCYIKDNDAAMPFFTTTKLQLTQGTSGSIVTANDRLIGIMTDGTEASAYRAGQPLQWISVPAKFTKSAYIIACLRKLQQAENDPAFNK